MAVAAALAGACRGSTSPSPPLDLGGAWSGMLGQPQSGSALRVTWTASQTGATVSGPATLVKPALNVPAAGTMSGTLVGSQLTLTYIVPAGGVPHLSQLHDRGKRRGDGEQSDHFREPADDVHQLSRLRSRNAGERSAHSHQAIASLNVPPERRAAMA
jgi:hypothetical protein